MLPLKDENPTRRAPVVTIAIIATCLVVYFVWQPTRHPSERVSVSTPDGVVQMDATTAFSLEYAAIPCEVMTQRPLTVDEAALTFGAQRDESCRAGSPTSPELFAGKSVWLAVLTSMFLHGSLLHIGGNLLFLWIFGNNIEDHLGHVVFALFYLASGVAAAALHIALNADSTVPVIGASGAIAGVMGMYLVWFPRAPVRTLVFLGFFVTFVRIPAMWLLGFWFVSQFFTNPNSGVAWGAHVGGFVFGALVGLAARSRGPGRGPTWASDRGAIAGPGRWGRPGGFGR